MRFKTTLALAMTAALVACGDDDDTGSGSRARDSDATATPAVTREEYIAKADELCKEANDWARDQNERVQRVAQGAESNEAALADIAEILEDGYERQRELNDEFQAVEPPAADREVIEKYWTAADEQTALVGRLADAAREGDFVRFSTLSEEQDRVANRAQGLAQGYGFKECGSGKNRAD